MLYLKILKLFFAYTVKCKERTKFMNKKCIFNILVFICIALFCACILFFSEESASAVRQALKLCATSVLPSLFPFYIIAKLITNLHFSDYLSMLCRRLMPKLFSVDQSAASALILGFIGGYPIGAVTCASLLAAKKLTAQEAERTLAFCNNCGPAFIIGVVGGGIFSSVRTGLTLFLIHIMAAITTGFVFRLVYPLSKHTLCFKTKEKNDYPVFSQAFTDAVSSSVKSCLAITGYIVLFSVITKMLRVTHILPTLSRIFYAFFGTKPYISEALISGIFEMTTGIYTFNSECDRNVAFVISALLLGWGGLSVHAQTLSVLSDYNLNLKPYFIGKLSHGLISAFYAYSLLKLFRTEEICVFAPQEPLANGVAASVISIFLLTFILIFCKKGWKKAE